ncbi:MAG: glycosyltransferase family 39 protein, partial [Quisquiliibacterium sp.]
MTLWLPAVNARNTYRGLAEAVATALPRAYDCIEAPDLGRAQRASLYYFADLRFAQADRRCSWLIRQDRGPLARTKATGQPGWVLVWNGRRPRDDDERLRLM